MPLIISRKENFNIGTDAVCVNDGPFNAVEAEQKVGCYLIHAGGEAASFYRNSLEKAVELGLSSLAMPLLDPDKGFTVVSDTIAAFLEDNELDVYLLTDGKEKPAREDEVYADLRDYLDRALPVLHYSHYQMDAAMPSMQAEKAKSKRKKDNEILEAKESSYKKQDIFYDANEEETSDFEAEMSFKTSESAPPFMEEERFIPDESFSECLIRMIDERHMTDPEVYKKANINRKHFNHIINDKHYRPKKETAVALAIGMNLNLADTNTLLERAGFVLSRSYTFDLIIRYCIEHEIYNIFKVNELLFEFDQKMLGC